MQADEVQEAAERLLADYEALAALPVDLLTSHQVVAVLDAMELLTNLLPTQRHRLLARLQGETTPREMGAKSWNEVLRIRWRMSSSEASRRLAEAGDLGPRRGLTGEPLEPVLPAVAAAQAAGVISAEHVKVLRDAMAKLPAWVDVVTRGQVEVDLVRIAATVGPKDLKDAAEFRLVLIDQDGPEPDDTEPDRSRGADLSPQGRDGITDFDGRFTPELVAVLEPLFGKYAAPGMCNPADPEPCISGTPTQAQIDNDHRTASQRRHDALVVIGRLALMSGDAGQLNGLPVSIIVRTTLQELESGAGVGVTGGGTKLPIKDVIRLGAHAHHYLAVFDKATGSALELFRARRTASPAQRIMLIARDGGCTKPGCTVGAYGCQVHHAVTDWARGGNTNVDEMALACGADNRLVGDGGYTTTITARGDVEWQPPPDLDHGQTRLNFHHRPDLLLRPPDDPPPQPSTADLRPAPPGAEWDTGQDVEADAGAEQEVAEPETVADLRPAPPGAERETGAEPDTAADPETGPPATGFTADNRASVAARRLAATPPPPTPDPIQGDTNTDDTDTLPDTGLTDTEQPRPGITADTGERGPPDTAAA